MLGNIPDEVRPFTITDLTRRLKKVVLLYRGLKVLQIVLCQSICNI